MAHITDGEDIADDAVAVAVDGVDVLLDVVNDHLALELAALVGVEADVVGVGVPVERGHVELTGGAVGRLAVEENDRLVLVGDISASSSRGGGAVVRAAAANEAASSDGGQAKTTDLEELTTRHCHNDLPFLFARNSRAF